MSAEVLAQIIITVGGLIVAFMGGLFSRRSRRVHAEVALSVEAREWAKQFDDRARRAEERAEEAERVTSKANLRLSECEHRIRQMERHIARLENLLTKAGIDPPPNPANSQGR